MIYKHNQNPININDEITINAITYPRGTLLLRRDEWVTLGITEEADPIPTPPTQAEIIAQTKAQLTQVVQAHLDAKAVEHGYYDILSACSYAGAVNPFQAEGQVFVTWRGNVWATCYTVLGEVMAGIRAIPTAEELLALLPAYV